MCVCMCVRTVCPKKVLGCHPPKDVPRDDQVAALPSSTNKVSSTCRISGWHPHPSQVVRKVPCLITQYNVYRLNRLI